MLHGAPRRQLEERIPPGIDVVELSTDTDYLPAVRGDVHGDGSAGVFTAGSTSATARGHRVAVLAATAAGAGEPSLEVSVTAGTVTVGDRVPVTVRPRGEGLAVGRADGDGSSADGPWAVVDGPEREIGVPGRRPGS